MGILIDKSPTIWGLEPYYLGSGAGTLIFGNPPLGPDSPPNFGIP